MFESVLSSSRIIVSDNLQADDLWNLVLFLTGKTDASVCFIVDNMDFPLRDNVINEMRNNGSVIIQNRVFPDPKVEDIMIMVDEVRKQHVDIVIGIGGGSALDSAKAVAMVLSNGGDLDDYLGAPAKSTITKKDIKLVLIPTTAGTGAEVTKFGVYTSRSGRKYTLNNPLLQSDVALLVPKLTYSMPPKLTAATGFDALSHALETLWNKNSTPVSTAAATGAALHILQWLEKACVSSQQNSVEGRVEMMMGACKAGIAFNLTGTAAVHALSFILSEEWHVPHGIACAFTLEDVLMYNCQDETTKSRLAEIAKKLFNENGTDDEMVAKLADHLKNLKKKTGMPMMFSDLGISVSADQIPALFERSFSDPKMKNNIVEATPEAMYSIIKSKC